MIESAEEFVRLRTSSIPEEYKRAGHEEAFHEIWLEVIEKYPEMRVWVARNRTISIELQTILAQDRDWLVREAIASKYPIARSLYEMLCNDVDDGVRSTSAYNKKTPLDILKKMMDEDSDEYVRKNAKGIMKDG